MGKWQEKVKEVHRDGRYTMCSEPPGGPHSHTPPAGGKRPRDLERGKLTKVYSSLSLGILTFFLF